MRVLHVGSGVRELRWGGLVAYVEDLMGAQVRRGHEVSYFYSGRYYPWGLRPRLRRRRRGDIAMFEVVDSPLYDHGRQPELELAEPRIERLFRRVLDEARPDVVHVQEVAGLPWSLLDVARAAGVPTVLTLQDYFALCPAFRLFDASGRVCLRREVGADCVATLAADRREPFIMFETTLRHDVPRLPLVARLPPMTYDPLRVALGVSRRIVAVRRRAAKRRGDPAAAFQRRRDVNVARLNQVDLVIAMSHRVAELHALLGVDAARLRALQLTLGHIEHLRPRRPSGSRPVTFATLAALESESKGARVLLDAIRSLSGAAGGFRVVVFGHVDPRFQAEAEALPGVELHGRYAPDDLDTLLDEVDVGLLPSIWEEAYAYAGVEFLAKGIPVIANEIGGMVDYARDGETGWLNRSCSAGELARIMSGLIEQPERVAEMNARVLAAREAIVKPLDRHAAEMDDIYGEIVRRRGVARRSSPARSPR